jgi:hypothetical protein
MKQRQNYYDHIIDNSPFNLKQLNEWQQYFKTHLLELFAQYWWVTLEEITDLFGYRINDVIALRKRYCDYCVIVKYEMQLVSFQIKDRLIIEKFLEAGKKWFA